MYIKARSRVAIDTAGVVLVGVVLAGPLCTFKLSSIE